MKRGNGMFSILFELFEFFFVRNVPLHKKFAGAWVLTLVFLALGYMGWSLISYLYAAMGWHAILGIVIGFVTAWAFIVVSD
jgi:hypothetical protein